jgi:Nucleotidyl transferase AbiEii toxin, Type IV TA system
MTELRSVELQLYRTAMLLRPVLHRMVFVGGVVRGLLVTDSAVEGPRTTDDVDAVIEISTLAQYQGFESELRKLGYKNDMRDGAPLCRYVHGALTLDVMPTEPALGFSNRWYPHAHRTATNHEISVAGMDPLTIRVVSAASFIATKLVSYSDRGKGDRYHRDLEDIIVLVDGRPSLLDELEMELAELRRYVADEITRLLADDLEQYVPGHLPADPGNQARVPIVIERLRRLAALQD